MAVSVVPEVGCLCIPAFPVACELLDRPDLRDEPVAVASQERPVLLSASATAVAFGVHPGQSVRNATALCPQISILDARPAFYREQTEHLLDALAHVVPGIEQSADGIFYLDLRGLHRRYSSVDHVATAISNVIPENFAPALGLASQKFIALVAASTAEPNSYHWVPSKDSRDFLRKQSIECLPAPPDLLARLRLFGFVRLGQLTAIPQAKFSAEFGAEGERLWLLASGLLSEPLEVRRPGARIRESVELEEPITTREQLVAIMHQLIGRIVVHPDFGGQATRQTTIQIVTEHQAIWEKLITFKHATANPHELSRILTSSVAQIELPAPAINVSISLGELTAARGWQKALPTTREADEERLHEGLRQLRVRYGGSRVFRPVILESWSQFLEDQCALLEHNP